MDFHIYGTQGQPTLLLLPGLGVSHEIFLPLIERLQDKFYIVAAGVDGFLIGKPSRFTSVDDQAAQTFTSGMALKKPLLASRKWSTC